MNKYTVIGKYNNGRTVVVHTTSYDSMEARRSAVQQIAFEIYDGNIPEGLQPMNDAIGQISQDFQLVTVLEGHAPPAPHYQAPTIFHEYHGKDMEDA